MSNTPRTDAAIWNSQDRSWMDGTLCRQIERELNEANKRIKRMEAAGDAMEVYCDAIAAHNWNKAKEYNP